MINRIKNSFEDVIDIFGDIKDYRSEKKEIRRTKFKEIEELRDIIKPDTEANIKFRDDVAKYAGRLFLVGNIRQDVSGRYKRAEESIEAIAKQFDRENLDSVFLNLAISKKNYDDRSFIFSEAEDNIFAAANAKSLQAYYGPTLTSHMGFTERDIQKTIESAESNEKIVDLGRTALVTVVSAIEASRHPVSNDPALRPSYNEIVDGGVVMLKDIDENGNINWASIYQPEDQVI